MSICLLVGFVYRIDSDGVFTKKKRTPAQRTFSPIHDSRSLCKHDREIASNIQMKFSI